MDRRVVLAVIAAVAVGSAGVGWFAGQRIKSPVEVAAETAAPEASLITVAVEERELSSRVIVRGTVTSNEATSVTVSGSAEGSSIITRVPKAAGDSLAEGDVVVEVAGRPMFVLQGELPVFRSLVPGMTGPDVLQLEEALVRLGYNPGTVDGRYDRDLANSVAAFYRDAGYTPKEPTADELSVLDSIKGRIREAERTLASSSSGIAESQRLQNKKQLNFLTGALNAAKAERDKVLYEPWVVLEEARAAVEATEADEAAHAAALKHLADAEYVYWITGIEPNKAVADAELDLAIERASQAEQASGSDQLGSVRDGLASDRAELARLQSTTGVSFPATELMFAATLPRSVQSVNVEVGSIPQGPVMTITGSSTIIESSVSASDRKLLNEGMEVTVSEDDLGIRQQATITFLADSPGGQNTADDRYTMRLEPVEELPEDAYQQSLKVEIPISSTGGAVLAVPLAAVSAGADGGARVEVERSDGSTELVDVLTGLSADGYVQITPKGGSVTAGDRVVVGQDLVLPGTSDERTEEDP